MTKNAISFIVICAKVFERGAGETFFKKFPSAFFYKLFNSSSIAFAAVFPAPIARMTVAAPVTASPPAQTPSSEVLPVSSTTTMPPRRLISSPAVVDLISGLGEVPMDMITQSQSRMNSEPGISTEERLPEASGSPSSVLMHRMLETHPFSSERISSGLASRRNCTPSSIACSTSSARAGSSAKERR